MLLASVCKPGAVVLFRNMPRDSPLEVSLSEGSGTLPLFGDLAQVGHPEILAEFCGRLADAWRSSVCRLRVAWDSMFRAILFAWEL